MNKYKVLDIFSGAGGFSNGFEQAGFEIIGAVEFDKHAAHTHKENHPDSLMFLDDITKLDINKVKSKIGNPDVIIGGFPCQGFSIAGHRDPNDPRNKLPMEAIKYVEYFKPKIFVMENVKGLISMEKGKTLEFIISKFEEVGYKVTYKLLKAVEYGVPQLRERLIITGVRNDIDLKYKFPPVRSKESTLGDYISDIEEVGNYERTGLHNHDYFTPIDEEIYNKLEEGQFLCDVRHGEYHVHSWEIDLKGETTKKEKYILNKISENRRRKKYGPKDGNPLSIKVIKELTGYLHIEEELKRLCSLKYIEEIDGKYDIHDRKVNAGVRIFHRDKPINTITTLSGTRSPYAHYKKPRSFTVRELARLQTFPDNFVFYGPITSQFKQVGNAVPPLLAKEIAESVKEILYKTT